MKRGAVDERGSVFGDRKNAVGRRDAECPRLHQRDNHVSLIVPCHRVVGADGSLTGYAGGMARKEKLLMLEGVDMRGLFTPKQGTALSTAGGGGSFFAADVVVQSRQETHGQRGGAA